MVRQIVWNKRPTKFLNNVLRRINEESVAQAERIERAIIEAVQSLPKNPEMHPPDKFKKNNPGTFRAFEKMSLRFAYKITETEIRILRIRHVRQEPK